MLSLAFAHHGQDAPDRSPLLRLLWLAALAPARSFRLRRAAARENVRLASVGDRLDVFLADGRMIYFPELGAAARLARAPRDRPKAVAAELASLLATRPISRCKRLGGAIAGAASRRGFLCRARSDRPTKSSPAPASPWPGSDPGPAAQASAGGGRGPRRKTRALGRSRFRRARRRTSGGFGAARRNPGPCRGPSHSSFGRTPPHLYINFARRARRRFADHRPAQPAAFERAGPDRQKPCSTARARARRGRNRRRSANRIVPSGANRGYWRSGADGTGAPRRHRRSLSEIDLGPRLLRRGRGIGRRLYGGGRTQQVAAAGFLFASGIRVAAARGRAAARRLLHAGASGRHAARRQRPCGRAKNLGETPVTGRTQEAHRAFRRRIRWPKAEKLPERRAGQASPRPATPRASPIASPS